MLGLTDVIGTIISIASVCIGTILGIKVTQSDQNAYQSCEPNNKQLVGYSKR